MLSGDDDGIGGAAMRPWMLGRKEADKKEAQDRI